MANQKPTSSVKRFRPSKKQAVIAAVVVVVLLALSVGAYFVWQAYQPEETTRQPAKLVEDKRRDNYLKESVNYDIPQDASDSERANYLRFQASNAYELKDYNTAIDRYQSILAMPGFATETDVLYGLGLSYEKLGQKAQAKEAYQRLLAAYKQRGITDKELIGQIQERIDQL